MKEIILKVVEYGQKRNYKDLQEYVERLSADDIEEIVVTKINSADFSKFWNYLLLGFTDTLESTNKRYKVVRKTLEELKEHDVSSKLSNSVSTRIINELPKFKTEHLLSLCLLCTEYIQQGTVSELRWRELLPELINVIAERELVVHNDLEMTGGEYKTQFINSLCMLQWSTNIIIPLTAMFIDMSLSKDEHLQVVNKLAQYVENLTPLEMPAFVYQVLLLGRYHSIRSIFLRLQSYFGTRIYSRATPETNSESMDLIEDSSDIASVQAESTVLLHIYESASRGHLSIKDYVSSLKNLTKSPEFVLHPFQLTVLLTISTVSFHEEKAFEIIRSCISRSFHEEQRRIESHWLRDTIPSIIKTETVLTQIVENNVVDRVSVFQGLINLGFVLLSVGAGLGRDPIVEKQWNLGKFILLSLIKIKPDFANPIFERLCNHIITGHNAAPCVDGLHSVVRKFPLVTLENKKYVVDLMEAVLRVPAPIADKILYAIMPLMKLAPILRDQLILLLRKALYSRATETRLTAVKGFLKLMANLKITNPTALSQLSNSSSSSSSGYSVLTQISLFAHGHSASTSFTNEALCVELLGILRRCFMQQAEIRAEVYGGLYDAVCVNPEIGSPVLDALAFHFNTLYVLDEDVLPPVLFSKITLAKDLDVTLQEPLGKLIYAIGCIVTKVAERNKDDATALRFQGVFKSLCKRMANCELVHFELDDGTNLLDVVPESQHKLLVLKEAMCVCEALIGYKIVSWNVSSENYAEEISSLFQVYNRLLQFTRNLSKPKKADKKRKDVSQQSEAAPTKNVKMKPAKIPNSILGFEVLVKFLDLLHGNVKWTTVSQANVLKTKHDLHRHVIQSVIQLLQRMKGVVDSHASRSHYVHLTEISKILYEKCIERLDEFMDFDKDTAVLTVECFYLILKHVSRNYTDEFNDFISTVANKDNIAPLIETYQKLFEYDEDVASDDADIRKLFLFEVNTLSLLVTKIPVETSTVLSNEFLDWLKQFGSARTLSSRPVAASFIALWFNSVLKFKSGTSLYENLINDLSHTVGTISEDNRADQQYAIVNELSATCFIQQLTSVIKSMLDDIDWVIARLRSEFAITTSPGEDGNERRREYLKSKERGICCQICLMINLLDLLSNVLIPTGPLSEAVLKSFTHVYSTLNCLTKYFMLRSTKLNVVFQAARFERAVNLAGKHLAPNVNRFVLYIEEKQKEEISSLAKKQSGNTLKNKVLREAKIIPKVVLEMELFSKSVIQLSNKTKVDLSKHIGMGTTRDFRIKDIKEVMEKSDENISASLQTSASNDDSNSENESASHVSDDDDSEGAPSRKKIKK